MSTSLTRRTLVGAAAWTAPAIALATASPAHAASVAGVIAFVDPEDLIGSGYTANLVVQLTPSPGERLPDELSIGYGTASIVDGPTAVATGGKNLVTVPVTGLDANGSTVITVGAPGYIPATTSLRVTFDDGAFFMARNAPFGVRHSANTLNPTTSSGIRSVGADGTIVDSWNGEWLYRSILASNTFTPTGTLFGGGFDDPGTVSGGIAWKLSVRTTGEDRLAWQQRSGFPFSGRPIGGTYQEGTTRAGSGIGIMSVVPAIRTKLSSASNPGGTAFFVWSFPRFPKYTAQWSIAY